MEKNKSTNSNPADKALDVAFSLPHPTFVIALEELTDDELRSLIGRFRAQVMEAVKDPDHCSTLMSEIGDELRSRGTQEGASIQELRNTIQVMQSNKHSVDYAKSHNLFRRAFKLEGFKGGLADEVLAMNTSELNSMLSVLKEKLRSIQMTESLARAYPLTRFDSENVDEPISYLDIRAELKTTIALLSEFAELIKDNCPLKYMAIQAVLDCASFQQQEIEVSLSYGLEHLLRWMLRKLIQNG